MTRLFLVLAVGGAFAIFALAQSIKRRALDDLWRYRRFVEASRRLHAQR